MNKELFFRKACAIALLVSCSNFSFAQFSGNYNVGTGQTYTSLTGAGGFFSAINGGSIVGDVTVTVTSDLTENGTTPLNDFTAGGTNNYKLTIIPDGTTERIISGTSTAGMLTFSGVRNLKIDGSFGGDNAAHLRISNTDPGTGAQTIKFSAGANLDTLMYCIIEGATASASTSTAGAVIALDAGTLGTSNIAILKNTISDVAATGTAAAMPSYLLKSIAGTGGADNNSIVVDGNKFINSKIEGMRITASTASGSNAWQVTNNAFYNTLTTTSTTARAAIFVNSGINHLISNNSIGGSDVNRGGTALTSSAGYTAINVAVAGGSTTNPVKVENNLIDNIAGLTTTTVTGINAVGSATIRNNSVGGIIPGSKITCGNILMNGISISGSGKDTVSGNTIRNIISTAVSTATTGTGPSGILLSTTSEQYIYNNTIDSIVGNNSTNNSNSVPNGINLTTYTAVGTRYYISNNNISNVINLTAAATTGYAGTVVGIGLTGNAKPINVTGNRITNIYGISTTAAGGNNVIGIIDNSGAGGSDTFTNNVIILGNNGLVSPQSWVRGVHIASGAGTNVYSFLNNSIYMSNEMALNAVASGQKGGASCLSRLNTNLVIFSNNIFVNNASNSNNGRIAALYYMGGATNVTASDYNVLYAPSSDSLICVSGISSGLNAWRLTNSLDKNSTIATVPFVSNTDLHLNANNAAAWNAYGRGLATGSVPFDKDGNVRSTTVGIPTTAGAYEISMPIIAPADMTMAPAVPVIGTPTVFSSNGRKIAEITWDPAATLPSTLSAKFYPGISAPGADYAPKVNSYFDIQQTGFAGSYIVKQYVNDAEANAIPYSQMMGIKQHLTDPYTFISTAGSNSSDADGNYLPSNTLTDFSRFGISGSSTPLPIDFANFNAIAQFQSNQLTWTMGNAAVKGSFEVLHSIDGAKFESIGTVAGNDRNNYTFNHETPKAMEVYQIKFTEASGKAYYSKTQMVQRKDRSNLAMMLYPNPTSQKAVLKVNVMNAANANAAYIITNILGEEVMKGTIETKGNNDVTAQINIGSLANGIYNFKLVSGNDQIVRKLVISGK